jgi:hypothetical protein
MATSKTAKAVADENVEAAVEAGEAVMAAPVMNINTANGSSNKISEAEMKQDVERAARLLGSEKTKSISIPKQMAPILGETIRAFINGAEIRVPVDGESYDIPAPYYDVIKDSLKTINSGDVRADRNLGKDVDAEALVSPTKR